MDYSSDGSFVWTDASNDSSDNEAMAKTNYSLNQSGEESESGKNYKKKLHQRLFSENKDDAASEPSQVHKLKKRKLSEHETDSDSSKKSKKKRVKLEPESEADTPKKKKKNPQESSKDLYDESFLNSKVKSEEKFAVPTPGKVKKKKKRNESDANDTVLTNGHAEDLDESSDSKKNLEDSTANSKLQENEDRSKNNKSKAKKNRQNQEESKDLYDESFLNSKVKSEEKLAVPTTAKGKKKRNDSVMANGLAKDPKESSDSEQSSKDYSSITSSPPEVEQKNKTKAKKNKRKSEPVYSLDDQMTDDHTRNDDETILQDDIDEVKEDKVPQMHMSVSSDGSSPPSSPTPPEKSETVQSGNKSKSSVKNTSASNDSSPPRNKEVPPRRKSRMSERIQFEDEEDSDVQMKSYSSEVSTKSAAKNKKLNKFIESSENLHPLTVNVSSALALTDNDDVWLVRCPGDVKADAFQDKKWMLDDKFKIKLNGQTYEGDIEDAHTKMTILNSDSDKPLIRNITINGCIRLRRRLPKAHMQENIMLNNQCQFIPLPDTKCRHPLFGVHYKKAIKLPSRVAERLRAGPTPTTRVPRAPKAERVADEPDPDSRSTSKKKKKKRKRSEADTEADVADDAPRHKKKKRRLGSAELWDSEKAIEENLFNF